MTSSLPDGKKMWIRSFYGFGPEEDGYVGWSQEVGREHFLKDTSDGDLIMIYGAGSAETEKAQRSYILGFVQIDAKRIRDRDKSSALSLQHKAKRGWADKWTYGIPVRRAWRAEEKLLIRQIATRSYRAEAGQAIGVWGAAMDEGEIAQALKIKVSEVNVFGELPVTTEAVTKLPFAEVFKPSRGFPGSAGPRTLINTDGETYLYLAKFEGDGHALVGKAKGFADRNLAMKIGVTNNLAGRVLQLNAGIPPAAKGKWRIELQASYVDRKSAEDAEQVFKDRSGSKLESLGREFFWGELLDAQVLFANVPGASRF
jgi:hypothetical protein